MASKLETVFFFHFSVKISDKQKIARVITSIFAKNHFLREKRYILVYLQVFTNFWIKVHFVSKAQVITYFFRSLGFMI